MRVSGKVSLVLCLALSLALLFTASAVAQPADMQGHWAEKQVSEWVDKGLAGGYEDGTFKPNNEITRAEFVALVNRAFDKQDADAVADYSDVAPSNWFYAEVAAASNAGYVGGYDDGTFKPQNAISRQEAASMVVRLLGLGDDAAAASFGDADAIGAWAKTAVNAVAASKIMGGYADGTFGPQRSITRAEAVVTLDRAMAYDPAEEPEPAEVTVYDEAGTYGPETGTETIKGDVTVEAKDVTLQNLVITGDLVIAEEVGDGDVTLNDVTVEGKTYIRGGGADSIYINGGKYGDVVVEKTATGKVRIVVEKAEGLSLVVDEAAKGDTVVLQGEFKSVTVQADKVKVEVAKDSKIKEMKVDKGLKDVALDVAKGSSVDKMVEGSKVKVTGEGEVKKEATGGGGGGGGTTVAAPEVKSVTLTGTDNAEVKGTIEDNTITFAVYSDTRYNGGEAELNKTKVNYEISKINNWDLGEFLNGTINIDDNLAKTVLGKIAKAKEGLEKGSEKGVMGSTLLKIESFKVELTADNKSTTYTVKFEEAEKGGATGATGGGGGTSSISG